VHWYDSTPGISEAPLAATQPGAEFWKHRGDLGHGEQLAGLEVGGRSTVKSATATAL